ncbi:hypothetical protein OCC_09436 [Thermococcus litoralis DSM 5473]|uniref:Uncharacterized protein n=1 Tax=Thermococcus litoralis (strain ATCC 51850 / DSM 5473 / JCM 8560 / NS-C) TaxID=523849 RepID=H3ZQR4_THELN|nr:MULTISPECIES: hypothetical protein [Thermococcus]ALV61837.1 hypothetical protein ADU37_CDS01380 [Thermococcus sp. 2319x1]EHR77640.1 hypothetical protein OCC_09436 [Thermococcus litoralis DSM 5473]MPW38329.1 hypothetical protein [Thermococcus sp. 101 C5]
MITNSLITNIDKHINGLLTEVSSDKYMISLLKNLKFRFERDGRVVGFNPITWKITVMNPTMGEIIKILQKKGSVKFSDLVTHLCLIYPETPRRIIKNDLKNAILWLFTNEFIYLQKQNTDIHFVDILRDIMQNNNKERENNGG